MLHTDIATLKKQLPIARLPLGIHLPMHRLTQLRKTVSAIAEADDDLLHNHASRDRVIYRYPLVQYKSISGEAAILGVGEAGVRSLEQLLKMEDFTSIFNDNGTTGFEKERLELLISEHPVHSCRLHQYIALNEANLSAWHEHPALAARAALLERCLTGHILKFCSAIHWLLPPRSLRVELLDYRSNAVRVFDNPFLAFDLGCRLPRHDRRLAHQHDRRRLLRPGGYLAPNS